MSEGKGSAKSSKAKAGAKKKGKKAAKKKQGNDSSKNNNEQGSSYESGSSQYNPSKKNAKKAGYNSGEAQYKGNDKAAKAKAKKAESPLERKVNEGEKAQAEAVVKELIKNGMPEGEARAFVAEMVSAMRKERSHKWADESKYHERLKAYAKNAKFKDLIKGTWYLFFALTDITPKEGNDPYKTIDEGASVVYLPGLWSIAKDKAPLEKALGKKVAYVNSTDVDEVHRVIRYAAEKHGRVQVVGFSDGGTMIKDYINKHGDGLVDHFYSVASNPFKAKSPRVTHIIGDRDRLASMEEPYTWLDKGYKGPKPNVVYGGHTYFCFDKRTLKETADIINSGTPTRAYYSIRQTPDSSLEMRLAA
jgi:hypothetical protein